MRLAGQLKAGFYPVPAAALDLLVSRLVVPAARFPLLDPCAGQGAALVYLAERLGVEPQDIYAIELDEGRGDTLRAALPGANILAPASAFGCQVTPWSQSFIWLNPPFDDHFGGGRVERDFLTQATHWLQPGGVLALCCPERVAHSWDIREQLQQWYTQVTVLEFPEECRRFDEVIVLAVRRQEPVKNWDVNWHRDVLAPAGHVYAIPPGAAPRTFKKVELTDLELARALAASPLHKLLATTRETKLPSPPLALGKGHLALLLASGHIDGLVKPRGEPPHVVRGTARKVEYLASETQEEDAKGNVKTTQVYSEKIQLIVRAVGPDGIIKTFEG